MGWTTKLPAKTRWILGLLQLSLNISYYHNNIHANSLDHSAPNEVSDQTDRMRNLIEVFAGCIFLLTLRIIYTKQLPGSWFLEFSASSTSSFVTCPFASDVPFGSACPLTGCFSSVPLVTIYKLDLFFYKKAHNMIL